MRGHSGHHLCREYQDFCPRRQPVPQWFQRSDLVDPAGGQPVFPSGNPIHLNQPALERNPSRHQFQISGAQIHSQLLLRRHSDQCPDRLNPQPAHHLRSTVDQYLRRPHQRLRLQPVPHRKHFRRGDGLYRDLDIGADGTGHLELHPGGKRSDVGRGRLAIRLGRRTVLHYLPIHLYPDNPDSPPEIQKAHALHCHPSPGESL